MSTVGVQAVSAWYAEEAQLPFFFESRDYHTHVERR